MPEQLPQQTVTIQRATLDRLLTTLDVALHSFAVCNVDADARLLFEPMNMVMIHYVLRGDGMLETPGHPPIRFGSGHMLIVPAGCGQALAGRLPIRRNFRAAEHCAMLVDGLVKFDASEDGGSEIMTICSTLSATYGGSFGLFDHMPGPIVRDLTALTAVRQAFDLLLAERARPDIGTHALTEALMKQCLVLFVRAELSLGADGTSLFESLRDPRLAAAVREVLREPAAPRTVHDLASIAGMSRSAFAAAFSEAFGQSPMDFVQKVRLHMAAKLLAATDLPVKAVAASMGFRSRSHFSRAFRAAYGTDPSAYRKAHRIAGEDAPEQSGRSWFERATSDGLDGAST